MTLPRLAAGVLALALTACADVSSVGQDPQDPSPTATASRGDDVVLRVRYTGGMVAPGTVVMVPHWTLYGDGRVITEGPQPQPYPGPAYPNVRVSRVSTSTVDRIAAAARDAGVDGVDRDYGDPPVMDASTVLFRLTTGGNTVETSVYGLAEWDEGNAARRKLRELFDRLDDLDAWLGAGTESEDESYAPREVAVYAKPYPTDPAPDLASRAPVTWHGPDPAAGEKTGGGRCTVLSDDALARVHDDLKASDTLTRWAYGDTAWLLGIRPLLPDEHTCATGLN